MGGGDFGFLAASSVAQNNVRLPGGSGGLNLKRLTVTGTVLLWG